jgi:hypothetical protein
MSYKPLTKAKYLTPPPSEKNNNKKARQMEYLLWYSKFTTLPLLSESPLVS